MVSFSGSTANPSVYFSIASSSRLPLKASFPASLRESSNLTLRRSVLKIQRSAFESPKQGERERRSDVPSQSEIRVGSKGFLGVGDGLRMVPHKVETDSSVI